jgi:hypothetical protein
LEATLKQFFTTTLCGLITLHILSACTPFESTKKDQPVEAESVIPVQVDRIAVGEFEKHDFEINFTEGMNAEGVASSLRGTLHLNIPVGFKSNLGTAIVRNVEFRDTLECYRNPKVIEGVSTDKKLTCQGKIQVVNDDRNFNTIGANMQLHAACLDKVRGKCSELVIVTKTESSGFVNLSRQNGIGLYFLKQAIKEKCLTKSR